MDVQDGWVLILILKVPNKIVSDDSLNFFLIVFWRKKGARQIIHMKCQALFFSEKKKKYYLLQL